LKILTGMIGFGIGTGITQSWYRSSPTQHVTIIQHVCMYDTRQWVTLTFDLAYP